jgi:hypothetical protein
MLTPERPAGPLHFSGGFFGAGAAMRRVSDKAQQDADAQQSSAKNCLHITRGFVSSRSAEPKVNQQQEAGYKAA